MTQVSGTFPPAYDGTNGGKKAPKPKGGRKK